MDTLERVGLGSPMRSRGVTRVRVALKRQPGLVLVTSLALVWSLSLTACQSNSPTAGSKPSFVVFAATSLQDVVTHLGRRFAQDQGVEIVYNFAGSNTLAQQIEAAPVADVFLSANVRWVDFLERADRLLAGSRHNFASNRLVVISRHDTPLTLSHPRRLATAQFSFLAVADPDAVPAGRYAKAFLQSVRVGEDDLWELVKDRVAPTPDVRAALGLVESDPAIIGIVYRTDAASSFRVTVRYEVPVQPQDPIVYCAAAVKDRSNSVLAQRFLDLLSSSQAQAVLASYGFVTYPPSLAFRPDTRHIEERAEE